MNLVVVSILGRDYYAIRKLKNRHQKKSIRQCQTIIIKIES